MCQTTYLYVVVQYIRVFRGPQERVQYPCFSLSCGYTKTCLPIFNTEVDNFEMSSYSSPLAISPGVGGINLAASFGKNKCVSSINCYVGDTICIWYKLNRVWITIIHGDVNVRHEIFFIIKYVDLNTSGFMIICALFRELICWTMCHKKIKSKLVCNSFMEIIVVSLTTDTFWSTCVLLHEGNSAGVPPSDQVPHSQKLSRRVWWG